MTKAMHDLAYDASCSAAKGKAVIMEKTYIHDMLGTLKGQMNISMRPRTISSHI